MLGRIDTDDGKVLPAHLLDAGTDDSLKCCALVDLRERRTQTHRHPWEVARFKFFRRLVRDHCTTPPTSVIDIGAGDGWFAAQLRADISPSASIVCWDAHYTTADLNEALPPGITRTTVAPQT